MPSHIFVQVRQSCSNSSLSSDGVETSRRVGWAKYFDEQGKVEQLKIVCEQLKIVCESLYDLLRFHDRIPSDDPLLSEASRLIQNVRGV